MQKMKNGLMMFCLTVLLSCTALMINTPTASAAAEAVHGNYRVTETARWINEYMPATGMVINFQMENGNLIGRVSQPRPGNYHEKGNVAVRVIYEDRGTIYCDLIPSPGDERNNYTMRVYDNGMTLKIFDRDGALAWGLRRL